jgi:hypothetical protein
MAVHLGGKMPHNIIAEILDEACRVKSREQVDALVPKIRHASRIFLAVVREFRGSLPAQERNRGLPELQAIVLLPAHPDDYCPLETAFEGIANVSGDVLVRPIGYFIAVPPERGAYDSEHSAMNTLLVYGNLQPLRNLVDLGADLSTWYRQGSNVGGGFADLIRDNVRTYIWMNQLLLHDLLPDFEVFCQRFRYDCPALQRPAPISAVVRRHAAKSIFEMLSPYDNHEYRSSEHAAALSHALSTTHEVTSELMRTYTRDHIFPELCSVAHVLLYSDMRRNGLPFAALTNPNTPLEYFDRDVEREFRCALVNALVELMPPIHGISAKDSLRTLLED